MERTIKIPQNKIYQQRLNEILQKHNLCYCIKNLLLHYVQPFFRTAKQNYFQLRLICPPPPYTLIEFES